MFFQYGEKEITYLKQKDKCLAEVIDKIGKVEREVDGDLFSSVIHHIIGQQISTKAQATIWKRMKENLGVVNDDTILTAGIERLQTFGMTFKKAEYIMDFAVRVRSGGLIYRAFGRKRIMKDYAPKTGNKKSERTRKITSNPKQG